VSAALHAAFHLLAVFRRWLWHLHQQPNRQARRGHLGNGQRIRRAVRQGQATPRVKPHLTFPKKPSTNQ
jgi:hypothetical protein